MLNVQGIKACTFTRRVSENGNVYFTGRSGSIKYTLLNDLTLGKMGQEPVWTLYHSEAEESIPLPVPPIAQGQHKRLPKLHMPDVEASRAAMRHTLNKNLGLSEIADAEMLDA